jgi:hypothetical protein
MLLTNRPGWQRVNALIFGKYSVLVLAVASAAQMVVVLFPNARYTTYKLAANVFFAVLINHA